MREQPWHLRDVDPAHYHWYRNLHCLNELTGILQSFTQDSRGSEPLPPLKDLQDLILDIYPDDYLGQLENTLLIKQANTLRKIGNLSQKLPVLREKFYEHGRLQAKLTQDYDLRIIPSLLSAMQLSRPRQQKVYLIRHQLPAEIELEWLNCPHQIDIFELIPIADVLCDLHTQWHAGFIAGSFLAPPRMTFVMSAEGTKHVCVLVWKLENHERNG